MSSKNRLTTLSFNTQTKQAYQMLIDFIDASIVFNLGDDVVDKTIDLQKLHSIKLPDAIIAATALVNGMDLVSRNTSDFKNITGLHVIVPWNL